MNLRDSLTCDLGIADIILADKMVGLITCHRNIFVWEKLLEQFKHNDHPYDTERISNGRRQCHVG
ncbi:hypothetical protein [Porphyromonas cangingivalis]|uniref:hypothetical protein n=1 Tax=Porphyromonas cangingivalis TaxID=36874 RepID=UPI00046E7A4E|nr:hypothetical protein [Porphyromonas cangingivalis]